MRRRYYSRIALFAGLLGMAQTFAGAQEPTGKSFQEIIAIAEWTPERFEQFSDDKPLDESAQTELARLLLRLRSLPAAKLAELAQKEIDVAGWRENAAEHRGKLIHISGRLVKVSKRPLASGAAAAIDRPDWFACEIQLEGGDAVEAITASVPEAWLQMQPLDQPVACDAVFLRRGETQDGKTRPQFVTAHIAWYPTQAQPPAVNFGMATLGAMGVDMAAWESITAAGALKSEDYTAFYETLAAMKEVEAGELVRLARGNLAEFAAPYRKELAQLGEAARAERRGTILREIVSAADEGRYSAWPLFLEADKQRGQLFAFEGGVRRAVRIDTSIDRDGNASDAMKRFGIDHYYEIELFTEDSQNLPLVFCVLELPEGFPRGDDLNESVRIAGFFFKTWHYHGRQMRVNQSPDGSSAVADARKAPLLIGRGPIRIATPTNEATASTTALAGGLLALSIAGVWFVAWWFGRGDKQFAQTTLAQMKSRNEPARIEIPLPNDD